MTQATPLLTFQPSRGPGAAQAMETYVSLFPYGRILQDKQYGTDGPGQEGTVVLAEFIVAGQHFRCSDSFIDHEWSITPGVSVMIDCDSTEEQQRLFDALAQDGRIYLPLDDYGFGPFGWVGDRFGLTWQLAG